MSPERCIYPTWIAGLSMIPRPWIPSLGDEFIGRIRGHADRWYRMRWHGWSRVDPPGKALVEALEPGPRAYDVLEEMRPVLG